MALGTVIMAVIFFFNLLNDLELFVFLLFKFLAQAD